MGLATFCKACASILTLCIQENPKRVVLQTEMTQNEMPQNVAFHQGLHCLLKLKRSSDKNTIFKIVT